MTQDRNNFSTARAGTYSGPISPHGAELGGEVGPSRQKSIPAVNLISELHQLSSRGIVLTDQERATFDARLNELLQAPEQEPTTLVAQLLTEGARLRLGTPDTYIRVAHHCIAQAGHMAQHSKDLSRVCGALGEMGISDQKFWHTVERYLRDHGTRVSAKRCATLAESAAKSGFSEPELFILLARKIVQRPAALPPLSREQSGRAFSSLNLFNTRLLGGISGTQLPSIDGCTPTQRTTVLNALSVLGVSSHPVIARLVEGCTRDLSSAPMSEITNHATLLSRMETHGTGYFPMLGATIELRTRDLKGGDIAKISRAFLRKSHKDLCRWEPLCARARELLDADKMSLINVVDLLNGLAYARYVDPPFLQVADKRLAGGIAHLPPSALTHAAESFARLREPAPLFFGALPGEITRRASMHRMSAGSLSRLVLPLGELRHGIGSLSDLVVATGLDATGRSAPRALACMTYALLMESDQRAAELFPHAAHTAELSPHLLGPAGVMQLYWAARALDLELPKRLELLAQREVAEANSNRILLNRLERKVQSLLRSLGTEPEPQVPIHGFHIDFVVRHPRGDFAIECDGVRVHHVGRESTGPLLGRYIVRDKVLERAGYRMLHLPNSSLSFEAELLEMLRVHLAA